MLDSRKDRIREVVQSRITDMTIVLDRLADLGNVHAILRTADALGFQNVHIIDSPTPIKTANRATQGAHKWLNITRWQNPFECLSTLKKNHCCLGSSLNPMAKPIEALDFSKPCAIILGNEKRGVLPEILEQCDEQFYIPMVGFTKSFNVSVAAGISMYVARANHPTNITQPERALLEKTLFTRSHPHWNVRQESQETAPSPLEK